MKELIKHFHRPLSDVAKDFDVCMTFMKKVCRGHGIVRWPYRKIRSLRERMSGAEDSIEAVECLRAIYYETAQGTAIPEEDLINTGGYRLGQDLEDRPALSTCADDSDRASSDELPPPPPRTKRKARSSVDQDVLKENEVSSRREEMLQRPVKFARAASTYHTPARENMPISAYYEPPRIHVKVPVTEPCSQKQDWTQNWKEPELLTVGDFSAVDFAEFFEDDEWLSEDSDQMPLEDHSAQIDTPKSVLSMSPYITA